MDIERLRALENAVELVAKATKGPWAFMNEKFDDCLLAFGTDSLEYDAPPPWYSCWTSINPDDGRALIAAVNFIREHGSALIAELGQEVGAVEPVAFAVELPDGSIGKLGWMDYASFDLCTGVSELLEGCRYVYAYRTSPAHTSEARDAVTEEAIVALVAGPYMYHHKMDDHAVREGKAFDRCRELTIQNIRTHFAMLAAMRQEAGSRE